MNYQMSGHQLKHAVEEMLLQLLPTALVQNQPDDGQTDFCASNLQVQGQQAIVHTTTRLSGQVRESMRESCIEGLDDLACKRVYSEIVKLGIYDTIAPALETPPVWGALTGVRPAKLVRSLLERGKTRGEVAQQFRQRYFVTPERTALAIRCAAYAQQAEASLHDTEVSLYIGIPFCPSRCSYCSFVSSAVERSKELIAPYVAALCQEIRDTITMLREMGKQISSIYVGGGTPTTLSAAQLEQLMQTLAENMDVSKLREYTVEAGRPDTITEEKLKVIRAGGADRISINPQTMQDTVLQQIGRKHTAQDVIKAYTLARAVGFPYINMDTIAGLTGDTPETFAQTIQQLVQLRPENITVHTLAIKRGADLLDRGHTIQQREAVKKMLDFVYTYLPQHGYGAYYLYRQKFSAGGFENIGWSLEGAESFYNIAMMEEIQTILACGAGAVSKRVDRQTGKIVRYNTPKYPLEYLSAGTRIAEKKRQLLDKGE